jgi:hypothetical protein
MSEIGESAIQDCPITQLRAAILSNHVFPVPIPIVVSQYRRNIQWRIAELNFVHGWSPILLAERYKATSSRVRRSLRSRVRRPGTIGYLQTVPAAEDIRPAPVFTAPVTFAAGASGAYFDNVDDLPVVVLIPPDVQPGRNHA